MKAMVCALVISIGGSAQARRHVGPFPTSARGVGEVGLVAGGALFTIGLPMLASQRFQTNDNLGTAGAAMLGAGLGVAVLGLAVLILPRYLR